MFYVYVGIHREELTWARDGDLQRPACKLGPGLASGNLDFRKFPTLPNC